MLLSGVHLNTITSICSRLLYQVVRLVDAELCVWMTLKYFLISLATSWTPEKSIFWDCWGNVQSAYQVQHHLWLISTKPVYAFHWRFHTTLVELELLFLIMGLDSRR